MHSDYTPSSPHRFILLHLQVKAEAELEQAQRVTQDKKLAMHEELLRKATAKEVGGASGCGHNRQTAKEVGGVSGCGHNRHGTGMLFGLCPHDHPPLSPLSKPSPNSLSPISSPLLPSFLPPSSLTSPHRLTRRWMQSVLVELKKARMRTLTTTFSVVRHTTVWSWFRKIC